MFRTGIDKLRVLIASDPRAYREVIAEALKSLRPEAEVVALEPEELEDEISRAAPAMVVCSESSPAVRDKVPVWVELYPGFGARSVTSIRGERAAVEDLQLSDLLFLVDRTEEDVRPDGSGPHGPGRSGDV